MYGNDLNNLGDPSSYVHKEALEWAITGDVAYKKLDSVNDIVLIKICHSIVQIFIYLYSFTVLNVIYNVIQ